MHDPMQTIDQKDLAGGFIIQDQYSNTLREGPTIAQTSEGKLSLREYSKMRDSSIGSSKIEYDSKTDLRTSERTSLFIEEQGTAKSV